MIITTEELRAIPTPERTRTWNPIPHYEVLDQVNRVFRDRGITVLDTRVDAINEGVQAFVTHTLDIDGNNDKSFQVGWRNSINKSLSLGFTAGNTILVCSNMVFNGEWIDFRRHTSGLEIETVYQMALEGVQLGVEKSLEFGQWMDGLREIPIRHKDPEYLFVQMLRKGIVPRSKMLDLVNGYDEEVKRYGNVLYTVYNTATQTFRDATLPLITDRSPKLNTLMDEFKVTRGTQYARTA